MALTPGIFPCPAAANIAQKLLDRYGLIVAANDIKLPDGKLVAVRVVLCALCDSCMRSFRVMSVVFSAGHVQGPCGNSRHGNRVGNQRQIGQEID